MTAVHYVASTHRLRLEGACRENDLVVVRDALDAFLPLSGGRLIVDLTAISEIDPSVAADLVGTAHDARDQGVTVTLVRKHSTPVDAALIEAERSTYRP